MRLQTESEESSGVDGMLSTGASTISAESNGHSRDELTDIVPTAIRNLSSICNGVVDLDDYTKRRVIALRSADSDVFREEDRRLNCGRLQ